jgi:hypothetical protein
VAALRDKLSTSTKSAPAKKTRRGVDLISDALPFGRLWYGEPHALTNAIGYAKFYSRSHDCVVRVFVEAGNVVATEDAK